MKRILILLCFASVVVAFSLISKTSPTPISFIGYQNGVPIFDAFKSNSLYKFNNKLILLKRYKESYSALGINDNVICYEETLNKSKFVVFESIKTTKRYPINSALPFSALSGDMNNLYYTDLNDMLIKELKMDGTTRCLNSRGYVLDIIDSFLYFTQDNEQDERIVNADLFVLNLRTNDKHARILSDISGECFAISSNRNYIYEKKLIEGEFKPVLFDLRTGKYSILKIDKKFLSATPFFDINMQSFIFYNSMSAKMKKVPINR